MGPENSKYTCHVLGDMYAKKNRVRGTESKRLGAVLCSEDKEGLAGKVMKT
jgi:hypothetical protein